MFMQIKTLHGRSQQFKTNNSVDSFVSDACKISLLQHIGLLIKSKFWNIVFLSF